MDSLALAEAQSSEGSGFEERRIIENLFEQVPSSGKYLLVVPKVGSVNESFSRPSREYGTGVNGDYSRVVIPSPGPFIPRNIFQVLQKWEGTVIEISQDEVRAIIKNTTTPEVSEEEVTFSRLEISESDYDLLIPGAIFYWAIGYEDSFQGQRTRKSIIRFRRLPPWTSKELSEAQREAKILKDALEHE